MLGDVWSPLVTLSIAWVLALPIAWHRERSMVGLRTLPLVSVASCGYLLMGVELAAGDPNAMARLIAGLMTGIGFIGGGAILKQRDHIHGTSTAAAVWASGAVGGAVAFDRIGLAVAVAVTTWLTFVILTPIGRRIERAHGPDHDTRTGG